MNALMRNLGASIGVASLVALLDRNVQINRSEMAEHLTPFSPFWRLANVPIQNGVPIDRARLIDYWTPLMGGFPFGSVPTDDPNKLIGMWTEELNRQAATIAYLNDFRVLAIASVLFIPLLFFMRRQAMLARPSRR
jgi:DHA2 family multidrug resistance protein